MFSLKSLSTWEIFPSEGSICARLDPERLKISVFLHSIIQYTRKEVKFSMQLGSWPYLPLVFNTISIINSGKYF